MAAATTHLPICVLGGRSNDPLGGAPNTLGAIQHPPKPVPKLFRGEVLGKHISGTYPHQVGQKSGDGQRSRRWHNCNPESRYKPRPPRFKLRRKREGKPISDKVSKPGVLTGRSSATSDALGNVSRLLPPRGKPGFGPLCPALWPRCSICKEETPSADSSRSLRNGSENLGSGGATFGLSDVGLRGRC